MQTFLPYPDFEETAKCLDNKRLGKQRIEAWQIYLALTSPLYGWKNHPAVKMWKRYEKALLYYGAIICIEWRRRGFKDSMLNKFITKIGQNLFSTQNINNLVLPYWLGDSSFHASHRSNLLRKNKEYYSKFNWKEPDNLSYLWPR